MSLQSQRLLFVSNSDPRWSCFGPLLVCLLFVGGTGVGAIAVQEIAAQEVAARESDERSNDRAAAVVSPGEITDVTLFRDSALVTRSISLASDQPLVEGPHEVLVTGLPEQLMVPSVFAEGNDSISIRAVRVVQEPIRESAREEVQELDEQLAGVGIELSRLQQARSVTTTNLQTLDQMIGFSRQAASADLNNGVLDAETLTQLMTYSMRQREELNDRLLDIENETSELNERRNQLVRERSQLTSGSQHTRYEARVFVDVGAEGRRSNDDVEDAGTGAASASIRLSYSVGGCGWSPQYTMSGAVDSDQVTMRYGAVIGQLSGESWDRVRLTLSTTSPLASASGPSLAPLRVRAAVGGSPSRSGLDDLFGGAQAELGGMEMENMQQSSVPQRAMPSQMMGSGSMYGENMSPLQSKMKSLRIRQQSVEQSRGKGGKADQESARDLQLNRLADEMQNLEFMASARKARGLASDATDEVATQTYVIEGLVSLESRREQQLVEIVEQRLTGELYHVAIPLLSSFAYREAELVNEMPFGLLSGPASIYLDDRFVGTMTVPTTASGQRLVIGFGADGQVRTRRELVNKSDAVQGGNRKLGFEYRLVLNNFKDREVCVRLLDRIPLSGQAEQIRVELGDVSTPISSDGLFERVQKPYGLLRWDLTLGATTHGSDATDVKYGYSVEFDRSRVLSVEPTTEQEIGELDLPGMMGGGMGGN
ncbi:DUF4139 domain-containing protein [Rhodopirellula sp. SWK7]|uniref:DUF4139 domain-containing protein n=1 Tax=Rhodopirellula sp. SWK7 TaxID=595460 RepID=UPI0002BE68CD|nr:DUF4139 domain-containing protein [Rhodopirellula sp. SWK7]EMI46662.1 hypothetical protein RRSWK_00794 [Rhodopirellula sp. SWK7]